MRRAPLPIPRTRRIPGPSATSTSGPSGRKLPLSPQMMLHIRTLYIFCLRKGRIGPARGPSPRSLRSKAQGKYKINNLIFVYLIYIYLDYLMLFMQRGCYAPRPFAKPPHQEDTWTLSLTQLRPIWQQAAIKPSQVLHIRTLYIFFSF